MSQSEIPLKLLTLKTVFLSLLATDARQGEIHATGYSIVTHAPKLDQHCAQPVLGFISKTQLRTRTASSLELLTIPSLGYTLGRDLAEDRHLCPVRCLKVCLLRTKPFRQGKGLLFISFQKNKSPDISKNTISGWVRSLLHSVYSNVHKDEASLVGRTTYAIRAIAASPAFTIQIEILKNCSWKSQTTVLVYLKDLTQVLDDLHSLLFQAESFT